MQVNRINFQTSDLTKKKGPNSMISTAKNMNITGFLDVTLCSQVDIYQCFKGMMANIH
ncbi:hypothetical protein B7P43_G13550 [Cryptotermes secundus]|uniref:Uncharacterized protein n=1 Tax=Cryptotermes secundus TaxID=105785 RepID=A0A2J7PYU6_9NEOP|nr:hypothetical protein B7P43_G13550 [Cryptotermes secundus]